MRRISLAIIAFGLVAAACSSDSTDTTVEVTDPPSATTTSQAATTTEAPTTTTTTTAPTTTTTAGPVAEMVPATPVFGVLQPYPPVDAGALLFPPGSVEAHWYQWDGLYVVLYRGWDASNGTEICAGNSWFPDGEIWQNITNSAWIGDEDQICVGTAAIAAAPSGVYACGSLLYYITEISTDPDAAGNLWGTLEIGDGEWAGQTSEALIDLARTPEFEPGLEAYELLPTDVDDGGIVDCG
jgi:hypothetical protein